MANVDFYPYISYFESFFYFELYRMFSCQIQVCDSQSGCIHACIHVFSPYGSLNTCRC